MQDIDITEFAHLDDELIARVHLFAWHNVARWLGHTALEHVADATTTDYLLHVSACVSEEGERRYAERAGLTASA
jgi:hypothetical protein